jgi:hypothetical protein
VTWIAWAAWGEAQAGDGGDLQGPDLDPPVAMVAGAVHDRDLVPRQPGELGVQGWLVGLDDQQEVGAAVDQKAGVVALGVQRIGRDDHTGKVEVGQQWRKQRDLVGGGGHLALGEHGPVVVVQRCQQVHLVAVTGRAAQPLAVHREHAAVARRVQPVGQPRADGGIHRVADGQHAGQGGRRPRRSRGSGIIASRSSRPGHSRRASGRAWSGSVAAGIGDDRAAGTGVRQVMRR